jgi:hypothetical protein
MCKLTSTILVIGKILSGLHTSTRLAGAFDLRAHADELRRMIDSITLAWGVHRFCSIV